MRTQARKLAQAAKEPHYFTGQPCQRGHVAKRFTKCGKCVECHRIFQAAWRVENVEKTKIYIGSWRDRNRQHCRDYTKEWQAANPDRVRENNERYYAADPEGQRERTRKYHRDNPLKAVAAVHRRRARLLEVGGHHTADELKEIFKAQKGRCAYCRKDLRKAAARDRHIDHIKPLAKGGTNGRRNLQFCCQRCNQKKNKKDPLVFARQVGMLL